MALQLKTERKKNSLAHVFVSYCHDNKWELEAVLNRLTAVDIPVWYDVSIEAGDGWKPQIDTALKESFAVVVVVTPESMKSLYVTYEWSWALGSSVPVIPMLLKGGYDDVHKRLLDEHVQDCRVGIPDSVIEIIKSRQDLPPDIEYLNTLIRGILFPLRVQGRIVTWFWRHLELKNEEDVELFDVLLLALAYSVRQIVDEQLPSLIVDKSAAFTLKQKQKLRRIMILTERISTFVGFFTLTSDRILKEGKDARRREICNWLMDFYDNQWLIAVDDLDAKYSIASFVDSFLNPLPTEEERETHDRLYETYYKNQLSKEKYDQMLSDPRQEEEHNLVARSLVLRAYEDEKLGNAVWEFINILRDSKASQP